MGADHGWGQEPKWKAFLLGVVAGSGARRPPHLAPSLRRETEAGVEGWAGGRACILMVGPVWAVPSGEGEEGQEGLWDYRGLTRWGEVPGSGRAGRRPRGSSGRAGGC